MATFKRRAFRARRRRRSPETYTVISCRQTNNMFSDRPCGGTSIDVIPLVLPFMTPGAADTTAGAVVGQKANVMRGMKFTAEHMTDPGEWIDQDGCDLFTPCPSLVAFLLTIWEAIVVLPLALGTKTVPAYLPDLTVPSFQGFDLADRVLWKRVTHMPMWGLQTTNFVPQLQTTVRDSDHGNQVVKASVRIDDRHGLFYVRNFMHNLVISGSPVLNSIPIQMDFWAKIYYNTSFTGRS